MKTAEKVLESIFKFEKNGDVYQQECDIVARCQAAYPYLPESHILGALGELSGNGSLLHIGDSYALTVTGNNEQYLAWKCAEYITNHAPLNPFDVVSAVRDAEEHLGIQLSPSQRSAAIGGLQTRLCIITGGPGSGKTTMLDVLCTAAELALGNSTPLLMAPTGKAAHRMSEQTGREASTIHSVLYTGCGYRRYADGELAAKLVVVDEASMLSTNLLADLLRTVSAQTRIVLVGDPDQLPAVGPGRILADLIASGLPVHRLTDNFRQVNGGCLAQAIGYIRDGRTDIPLDDSLQLLETLSSRDAEMLALSIFASKTMEGQKVQLLSPIGSAGGVCSTTVMNDSAQAIVNPANPEKLEVPIGGTLFRLGDRVIQTKNNEYARNGDIGRITNISNCNGEVYITVLFGLGDTVTYSRSEIQESALLDLAYALTVHKAQGSEYDYVIVPIVPEHLHMWSRNMMYTAASRARKSLILVGMRAVFEQAITTPLPARDTRLLERIDQLRQTPQPA